METEEIEIQSESDEYWGVFVGHGTVKVCLPGCLNSGQF